jgi:ATP-dependent helicase/nuclease subunit A
VTGSPPVPTDAQRKASGVLDRHIAVTAGPGAGKTRVLVTRYVEILDSGAAELEKVVAITFTSKAAREMRERVRRHIDERIEWSRAAKAAREEAVWRDRKRRLEGAVITTIHGFCSRLIRENPVEAVVDPQFVTLDDYSSEVLLDASVQAAVTSLIDEEDEAAALLVAAYGRSSLVRQLKAIYTRLRSLGVTLDTVEATTLRNLGTVDRYRSLASSVPDHVSAVADAASTPAARAAASELLAVWNDVRSDLERDPAVDGTVAFRDALGRLQAAAPDARGRLKEPVEALRSLVGRKDKFGTGLLEKAFFDATAREFAPLIFRTLKSLDRVYTFEKRIASALDYEDLQLRARDLLMNHDEVVRRVRARYKYFLVDEYQDTNGLQRDIVHALALGEPRANLFVVGDRKQSVYGFRGAEVEVFGETIRSLEAEGGEAVALDVNFRSDPRIVAFVNAFFERLMVQESDSDSPESEPLGFVAHEPLEARRPQLAEGAAVEILVELPRPREGDDTRERDDEGARDREARRLAERILALVRNREEVVADTPDSEGNRALRPARFGDIAIVLRAFTSVKTYERALRQLAIPYYVVAGKGFYDRPEVADLLNLASFLDNRTDELTLAAVLRSPLFGVSDETLLAFRADWLRARVDRKSGARTSPIALFDAVREHEANMLIADSQRTVLESAATILERLLQLRNRLSISELLAEALRLTEYEAVIAATDDGGARLSNVDKLLALARAFERGGSRLLRDLVEYVREFRRLDTREAEATLRSDEDAVAILTAHKAKGLEFPIVVIPDLQREFPKVDDNFLFDRALGLAFRVPDSRGGLAKTDLYERIAERARRRGSFESMRLFYVAATRAEDMLILSGASSRRRHRPETLLDASSWLQWLGAILGLGDDGESGEVVMGGARVRVVGVDERFPVSESEPDTACGEPSADATAPREEPFVTVERVRRLLGAITPADIPSMRRFSVTELQNYANCPRQYYYGRTLRIPSTDARATILDDAEQLDEVTSLPAAAKGVLVHRFCETYLPDDDIRERLRLAVRDVRTSRGDDFGGALARIDAEAAVEAVLPLARNYVASRMRRRIDERLRAGRFLPDGSHEFVRSELPFTLRTRHGFVVGTVDKLLLTPLATGRLRAFVVDFKTGSLGPGDQKAAVERAAFDYALQAQIYTQAVRRLLPGVTAVEAALHFLAPGPDVEYEFGAALIAERAAAESLDRVLADVIAGGFEATAHTARPGPRCYRCRFASFCPDAERPGPAESTTVPDDILHAPDGPFPVQGSLFD